jgi:hypothetical protein
MLELTSEQRIRLNQHKVAFYKNFLQGTINHCVKLFNTGMICEAVEILSDFKNESKNDSYKQLLTLSKWS